ncbi:hypothetical protein HYC85_028552 [Camellia sinensis]|uniref:Uncharacterized protein n=1 Tax=Camellia sinensis TaxID=4442 RepID=A0A7J7FWN8_CAMSI|nr:hypothetical protein HYC85_028552 [Camellia sinensis]
MNCPELGYAGMQTSSVLIEHGKRSPLASCTARLLIAEKIQPGCRAPSRVGWQFG